MTTLEQYSLVCQAPGSEPYTTCAYTGKDLSEVLGISQATSWPGGTYGWMQVCGEGLVRVVGGTQAAYADFRPNEARLQLCGTKGKHPGTADLVLPPGTLSEESLNRARTERLSQLPALLIEAGAYCSLLKEARDVFVDGHFYACVAMCGICFERFQRDKAVPHGGEPKQKLWHIRAILQKHNVLAAPNLELCQKMAKLRNVYAHGLGSDPRGDAFQALTWMHCFIDQATNLMRDYVIVDGVLHRNPITSV